MKRDPGRVILRPSPGRLLNFTPDICRFHVFFFLERAVEVVPAKQAPHSVISELKSPIQNVRGKTFFGEGLKIRRPEGVGGR